MPSTPQTVATVVLFDYLTANGTATPNARVSVILNAAKPATAISPLVTLTTTQWFTTTDPNGYWQFSLPSNTNISPANTYYTVSTPDGSYDVTLGATGPYQSTALGTIVNVPVPLTPASNPNPVTLTGLLTAAGGEVISGGTGATLNASGDIAGRSFTASTGSGPYTATAAAGGQDIASTVRIAGGRPWADPTHPKYGCVGDGTTDDYAPAAGSGLPGWMADLIATQGVGFLPAGKNFRTSHPIQIWQASGVGNIWIMGSGMTSCGFTVLATDYGNFVSDFVFTGPGPSWIVTDVKFSDFKIDGQARNGAAPASRCGGISFGARTRCERVWLDDINWLAWSMRNSTTPDDTKIIDCRSSRGNAAGSDNISGGFNLQGIYIVHHRWDANLACLSCFDFVPAKNVRMIDCVNYSTLSIMFEAMTNSIILGLISTGGGGIVIQSDQGYAFAGGTTNCSGILVTGCILVAANASYQASNFQSSICVNFGKGGAATVLGYGIAINHNTIIGALLCAITWLQNDSTYSSGGNSCDHNTIIDCNANNSQVGVSILGTSTVDGGVGIFFAHGGSVGDTCLGNRCVDQRTVHNMRHGFQFGQSNGGAASQAGSGLYVGLDNRVSGTVAAGSNYYQPGTLITVPNVRNFTYATGVSGAQTIDPSASESYFWVLSGSVTINAVLNPLSGMQILLVIQQDGVGTRTVGWDVSFDTNWQPVLMANARSAILLDYDGINAKWRAITGVATDQLGHAYHVGHLVFGTTAPASSALNAQITSVTPTGTDTNGELVIVVAVGGLAANTKICTITYNLTYSGSVNAPLPIVVNQTPSVGFANADFYTLAESVTAFDLYADAALVAGTYKVRYLVLGRK
jgi:hypothetical protein